LKEYAATRPDTGAVVTVVNDQLVVPLIASPAASFAPLTVAVYVVPDASAVVGVKATA
jgi:hypothetical protein